MFNAEVSNLADNLCCELMMHLFDCSYLLHIFLQVGKIKVTASEDPLSEFPYYNDKWDKKG